MNRLLDALWPRQSTAAAGPTPRWRKAQELEKGFWKDVRQQGFGDMGFDELFEFQRRTCLSLAEKIKPVDHFQGDVVVDIGCGPIGFLCYLPCKLGIGIDPLLTSFAAEYEHLHRTGSRSIWVAARGEELPLASACADVVFSRNVLDHVDMPEAWLHEFARVLRPGGQFMLYVHLTEGEQKAGADLEFHPHDFSERSLLDLLHRLPLNFSHWVDRIGAAAAGTTEVPMIVVGTRTSRRIERSSKQSGRGFDSVRTLW